MNSLSSISLASLSLDSSTCTDIVCGSNGLPLTPNSIKIIGEFKAQVEHVEHPNLIKYVECFRNKNERVTLVFENLPFDKPQATIDFLKVAKQLLDALYYLHNDINCVHGLINPDCIVWTQDRNIKLAHWPINLLTNGGSALGSSALLCQNRSYIAPEQVKSSSKQATQQSDIWSAGLTLLKLIKPSCKLLENPSRLAFCDNSEQILDQINGDLSDDIIANSIRWNEFFKKVLQPDPEARATLEYLYEFLDLEQFCSNNNNQQQQYENLSLQKPPNPFNSQQEQNLISNLNISEIYYLWRLSIGRNFESEQKHDDCPPIFKIPYLIVNERPPSNSSSSETEKLKEHIIIETTKSKLIPLEKFIKDIAQLDKEIFNPTLLSDDERLPIYENHKLTSSQESSSISKECNNNSNVNDSRKVSESFTFADLDNLSLNSTTMNTQSSSISSERESSKKLPIVIKEADFAYQCERIVLFKRLIASCPKLKDQLRYEASIDIPPYYRAQTWAILLEVDIDRSRRLYENIDKTTPVATDRQISVDIPRCHQYNELMASPQGHKKLARILKAWLNYNSAEYVYWQGLDSLAAPFLLLNFDDEAMAFACFNAFVNKYLRGFFKKDNQLIVQQYLTQFSELLLYHDPFLASHLDGLGFLPNLYAIPWFLTMFTHVLPLHKILHVWDCLLLGNEKFPLCLGLAILNQLRPELMDYNFNDCIVAFSDMPEIDIERCIRDALQFYNTSPESWK